MKIQKFTITLEHKENGEKQMSRCNDGFTPLELLGLLDFSAREIIEQMRGVIKPDIVKREIIAPVGKYAEFDKPLSHYGFSKRVLNLFKAIGVTTIAQVAEIPRRDFVRYRNIGKGSMYEVYDILYDLGIKW